MKPCDCCEGTEPITPLSVANQPGLNALHYRMGSHATFLETMKAALSSLILADGTRPLTNLTARDGSDPAIAWLDGWATVADVLTFYQERIANEGYLRTAAERRSILELARLVGYKLRPGVAATVFLAYTVENGYAITIPAGSRAQSIPGAGELPQSFETAEPLLARDMWSNLKPRLNRPQAIRGDETDLYLAGINANLKANDPLLFVFDESATPPLALRLVENVTVQASENRTLVTLQMPPEAQRVAALIVQTQEIIAGFSEGPKSEMAERVKQTLAQFQIELTGTKTMAGLVDTFATTLLAIQEEHKVALDSQFTRLIPWVGGVVETLAKLATAAGMDDSRSRKTVPATIKKTDKGDGETAVTHLANYLSALAKPPSRQPANSLRLGRNVGQTYAANSDMAAKLLRALQPDLAAALYPSWRNLPLTDPAALSLYALRTRASVFGHNAPLEPIRVRNIVIGTKEWELHKESGLAVEDFNLKFTIFPVAGAGEVWELLAEISTGLGGSGSERGHFTNDDPQVSFTVALKNGDSVAITIAADIQFEDTLAGFELNCEFGSRPLVIEVVGNRIQTDLGDDIELKVASIGEQLVVIQESDTSVSSSDLGHTTIAVNGQAQPRAIEPTEEPTVIWLDAPYDQVVSGSWLVVARPYALGEPGDKEYIPQTVITRIQSVSESSRAEYGITGKGTRLVVDRAWIDPNRDNFRVIRETAVFAQNDLLTLAEAPIDPIKGAVCGAEIELAGLYDGLEAGRWLIITGERTDVQPDENTGRLSGLTATELVMLAGVAQIFDPTLPGETAHTKLFLAEALAYCYKRDTVTIYGNVVKATHGETRQEVLGSGNGRQSFPAFTLKQPPLTYLSAPNPSGVQSSLTVRVNDIQWHEADNLTEMGPNDREFTTQTDNEDKTTVIFGDGRYGARLPTGSENVKAMYRNGIGKVGNVVAGQISLLLTRPLGVKAVINPLRASGGTNRDSLDQARSNAPLAVMALDRLVSTQDYADFARTFAGIGKASAVALTDGRRKVIHLTIAGVDDIPLDKSSDLYRNLRHALHQFGDPYQPIQIDMRQRKLLIISAKVRLLADYLWEAVAPQLRGILLNIFSFDRRELGQDVTLSELMSALQGVAGVAYVDVDILDAVAETADLITLTQLADTLSLKKRVEARMAWVNDKAADPDEHIQPAQLVYLSPDIPDTLILTELT